MIESKHFEKGDKSNYKIKATFIKETYKSYYLNCEGDLEWFPKSCCHYEKTLKELELPEWLYRIKFSANG